MQLAPATMELPQASLFVKSPVVAMVEIRSSALPEFVMVTVCAGLVVPTGRSAKVRLVGATVAHGAKMPVPLSAMVCGEMPASSVIVTKAKRIPAAAGVNLTLIAQLLPARTNAPQLLLCAKSAAFTPVTAMPAMFNVAVPVFDKTTVCGSLVVGTAWLAKVRLVGARLTTGTTPVPDNETVWGLPAALSAMVSWPFASPGTVGTKLTLIRQLAPATKVPPQGFVWLKAPVTDMLEIANGALPVFESVTTCAGPVPP